MPEKLLKKLQTITVNWNVREHKVFQMKNQIVLLILLKVLLNYYSKHTKLH